MKTTPNPIDIHVGEKLRSRRKALGLSQGDIATHAGIKFQQVQKYETGHNRISASRLFEIAEKLQVAIGFFWEGLPSSYATSNKPDPLRPQTNDEAAMLIAYRNAGTAQASLLELAKAAGAGK